MNVGQLRDIIRNLPDDAEILYEDPNFSGPYYTGPELYEIKIEKGILLIGFPLESAVEF